MGRAAHLPPLQVGKTLAKRRRNSEIPLASERFRAGNRDAMNDCSCEGFRTPARRPYPHAPTAGVRKAPMDEIARGGRLRCGRLYEGLIETQTPMRTAER